MLLLRFPQGSFGLFTEDAVRGQLQQALEHLRRCPVCITGAAPANGRQDELQVGGGRIVQRRVAQPRCLSPAGVCMTERVPAVPVDADAAETDRLSDDAQRQSAAMPYRWRLFVPPFTS